MDRPSDTAAARANEPASQPPVDDAGRQWEIGQIGFGGAWYIIGIGDGATATSAVASWIASKRRRIPPATYGVRSRGETAWQTFSIDSSGEVHDLRLEAEG